MDRVLSIIIYCITFLARLSRPLGRIGIGSFEEWSPGRKFKVLLVGYNGARNTGSDVRVITIARQVKELFGEDNVEVTVMTLDAKTMEGYFDDDVRLFSFTTLFPGQLFRACSSHHAAILCEGSTLKSTFANGLSLFLCEAAGVMAAQKKPCVAFGSEVGRMDPFLAREARRLCRDTYFITRTKGSLKTLESIGLKGHAGTDAAWTYDQAVDPQIAKKMLMDKGWDGEKPLLGIAVIDPFCWPVKASLFKWIRGRFGGDMSNQYDKWYFFNDSGDGRRAYEEYIDNVAAGVKDFLSDKDHFPVLIGMEKLDEKACNDLKERMDGNCATFLSGEHPADEMTGMLGILSCLVTSRYHGAVLSMEGGCPIIAVSMDERLDGIMEELGLDDKYLFHMKEESMGNRLADKDLGRKICRALHDADEEHERIREHIRNSRKRYAEMQNDMGEFLRKYVIDKLGCEEKSRSAT